ncbi:unnamed protein product [Protopolystoma xenopodis]|uniref:Transmembrane protein 17B n=1 Tax=Protopolystoma xenopodis TaxID=117903 RepID=A0A448X1K3_9PLAT|nr:unnamed protein product [Protopolystoma xenopodis]
MSVIMSETLNRVVKINGNPFLKKGLVTIQFKGIIVKGFEYVSNLPLQMAFYFNSLFAPFWFIGTLIPLIYEFYRMTSIYQVINCALLSICSILEILRLILGMIGNLTEKVPELAGSWLLTLLLQLPSILFFLLNENMIISSFERSIHLVEFFFVSFEAILGFFVIKLMVQSQAIKFHTKMHLGEIAS